MKTFNAIFMALLCLFILSACEKQAEGEKPGPKTISLIPDQESINADGEEKVTFTVMSEGTDISSGAKVFLASDGSELADRKFSTDTPGDYEFYATYGVAVSETVTIKANGSIDLSCDNSIVVADGKSMVSFTVSQEGEDVSDESVLYHIGKDGGETRLEGMSFYTTEAGRHRFYAMNGTFRSAEIELLATAYDNEPDKFDGFRERGLILAFTAQGCGYCPSIKGAWKTLKQEGWDDGVMISSHIGFMYDNMKPDFWEDIWEEYRSGSQYVPLVTYNLDKETKSDGSSDAMKNCIRKVIDKYPLTCGIAATYLKSGESEAEATALVKIADDGDYRVSICLLEDNIEAYQASKKEYGLTPLEMKTHNDVLRAMSHTHITGKDIEKGAKRMHTVSHTFKAEELFKGTIDNSHIVVLVAKKEANGEYIVNNIIKCEINDSVGFEYK